MYGFLTSLVILTLLYLILARSRFGRSVRATIQNPVSAELLGIDPQRVAAIGFGLSVATATAAGAVYGIVFSFNPGSHYDLISRLLTIIVLGGLGSLGGAVVASLVVGRERGRARRRDLAHVGVADVLPRADRGADRATAGAVRPRRAGRL